VKWWSLYYIRGAPHSRRYIKDFDALRQYFRALRLTSELVDLRVGNANLIFGKAKEQGRVNLDAPPQKQKGTRMDAVSVVEQA